MCQISVNNLHDERLNKLLFLLEGSFGSVIHDDGWGFSTSSGKIFKCAMPLHLTMDAGNIIHAKKLQSEDAPILGHVRQASPSIPINRENAHPFTKSNIVFAHNGKLTPKKEADFVMEIEVEEIDEKTKKTIKKKVKKSDSQIFFEKFVEFWTDGLASIMTEEVQDTRFCEILQKTMDLFYGKFAMVFIINQVFYIVRGRTADLHISYMKTTTEDDSKSLGWAINTDKKLLDTCVLLLSNIQQMDGKKILYFTTPEMLEEETVFKAEKTGLKVLAKIKEGIAPVTSAYEQHHRYMGGGASKDDTNFTKATNTDIGGGVISKTPVAKYTEIVAKFMLEYSLSPDDIQNIFLAVYESSLLEVTESILKHFTERVIPNIQNLTNKNIKKAIKKARGNLPVGFSMYDSTMEYPWMMNPHSVQMLFSKK